MMKWRENAIMKAVAFMAAVAAFTATAIMGWYQLANFDALWNDTENYMGYTIHYLLNHDSYRVRELIGYYETQAADVELSPAQKLDMEWLEQSYSTNATNLRWQLLDENNNVIYGNTDADSFAINTDCHWYDYARSTPEPASIDSLWTDWETAVQGAGQGEDYAGIVCNDAWREVLPELAEQLLKEAAEQDRDVGIIPPEQRFILSGGGEYAGEPITSEAASGEAAVYVTANTALADEDGVTNVLTVQTSDGEKYAFLPTLQACVTANQFGYRFAPDLLGWVQESEPETEYDILAMWVEQDFPADDQYRAAYHTLARWRAYRTEYLTTTIVCAAAGVVLLICLCCGAGHKRGAEGIYLNWFHRVPGDVLLALLLVGCGWAVLLFCALIQDIYGDTPMFIQLICIGTAMSAMSAMGMSIPITFCARAKAHTLWRNTVTCRVLRWGLEVLFSWFDAAGRLVRAIPLIWKAVLCCMAYTLFTIVTMESAAGLWLLVTILAAAYLCLWAYQWKKIRIGTQEIIGGNPDYHIDTARMLPDLKGHADELNNLGHAISTAVDDRLKSEHFKAELITNVSHDLKTPLTSIINYVDLLKKEDIDNPRAAEYIEVLDRKSQRLKKLTEDLVEASKASTGSLAVNWERIGLTELADQALAEYAQRLEAKGLSVVRTFPDTEVWVRADGRHLWRVLDNLLSNCAKYALEGTRVYIEIRQTADRAVLAMKNISRDELNVAPEALLERFVRGDESRTTEGSGLGLSIAQSLTELQSGRFELGIDGDLFKATVTLPLAEDAPLRLG